MARREIVVRVGAEARGRFYAHEVSVIERTKKKGKNKIFTIIELWAFPFAILQLGFIKMPFYK
jgi:hypothetical protein